MHSSLTVHSNAGLLCRGSCLFSKSGGCYDFHCIGHYKTRETLTCLAEQGQHCSGAFKLTKRLFIGSYFYQSAIYSS